MMDDNDDGTSRTDRPGDRGADLGGPRRPAEAGGGPEGPKLQNWKKKKSRNTLGLPEQLHLKRLYQVPHRASLKTAATSSHCVQLSRNTSNLLDTFSGSRGVDNVAETVGLFIFLSSQTFCTVADLFSNVKAEEIFIMDAH